MFDFQKWTLKLFPKVKYPNVRRGGHDSGGGGGEGEYGAGRGGASDDHESTSLSVVPKMYKKVAIKLSKLGSDDFDFDRYNR